MAGPPDHEPIGLRLTRAARTVGRAFDSVLAEAGGSLPVWLILVSLKAKTHGAQSEIAAAIGIEGATLTHHLNRMEAAGLVTRRRDPANRRVHRVELTAAGEKLFLALLQRVVAFDEQLRAGFSERDLTQLGRLLDRMAANAIAENQERSKR
jgi:MarR family transcriptional regulator for hemolysin